MADYIHMNFFEKLLPCSFGHGSNSVTICKCCMQTEFSLHFRSVHPSIIIRKQSFNSIRPFWVKKMKDRNVCCYIYHVKMEELRVGFNHMKQKCELHLVVFPFHGICVCLTICVYMDPFKSLILICITS
jgi:hypothetical protein